MKNSYITIVFIFILASCNHKINDNNVEQFHDTINITVYDTLVFARWPDMKNVSEESIEIGNNTAEAFYSFVNENETFDRNYVALFHEKGFQVSSLIHAMLVNPEKYNESVLLFFLKLYKNQLINNDFHTFNISVSANNDPYLALFSYAFFIMSNTLGPLFINDIYNWANSQKMYLKNSDIKSEVKTINQLLENK
jgi:hypothetical protein